MKFWKSALLYAATVCTLTAVSCSDETKEPNLYTTAVTDDGNGTAKAAPASAAAGETITLTATPKENFSFAKWTVVSGDAELKSATANPTTFAMPAANVEIKAEFAAVPSQITVTDDGNGTAEANPASAIPGETVTLTATPAENFFFLKWTVLSGGIELENPTENPTTFTLPEGGGNIEIRAEFTDLLSLAASEIIAYDAEKAATVTRLSVGGDLTDEVTAAIFDKFQNLLFLELTDAKAIPDNFMYDAGSRAPKQTKLEELNAPEVTSVGVNAFRNSVLTAVNNSSLRTVHLPKVQTIGERTFSDLWTLEEAGSAFFYCGGPTSISLPKLKTAGESCFAYSTKLTQIDIPNVEKLEKMAMYACNGLLSFSGEKVESVGAQCFERCYALKEVSFPAATAFGSGCFIDCESLTKVNFPLCTAISDKMFFIAQASVCTSTLKTIDLSNITTIGTSAFEGCKALEDVVDFSKVTTVGERAFRECITLKNVDLSNVTTTGDYAFFRCWGFTGELNMPKLTAPGKYLFRECKNITKVSAPVLENMSLYMFAECTALADIDMPVLKKVENFSFNKCEGLTKVDMPTVETIIAGGFSGCVNIKTINLPNVKSIGGTVFNGCALVTTISLPALETFINNGGAFSGMTGLTSYDVPLLATLETVPSSLFQNCKSLTAIDLPAAKELGMNAIRGCDALESISLPNVEKVGNFCFAENPKLKEVDLPKATSLGTKAFDKCTALTTLKLGATTAITLANDTFTSADVPAACNLFLNAAGVEYPTAAGQQWKNLTWKSIASYIP